ncbi:G5 and 3D domain-containing protein [Paradesulfitobacterium ferrireducens]|uniref:G5 and 3D domain-containing protein n=1 Tax=Paradesulfitobacterium ferrireducens TaxID=2816476 RepID=UPI001A8D4D8E|nr:3D domain-containing protein [Paradesulfitobacterium ferrireducens]
MYSLPIMPFADYWRQTRLLSSYLGGAALLVAGTSVLANSSLSEAPLNIPASISKVLTQTEFLPKSEAVAEPYFMSPLEQENVQTAPVQNITTDIHLEDVPVDAPTEFRESNEVPPGMSRILEEGQKGIERRVIKTTFINGEVSEETVINQFMLNAPKKRVVIRNTKPVSGESLDLSKLEISRSFVMEATAYTYTGNRTATGVPPREGLIAVDPKVIPLGSKVYVEGYGYAVAADTGGAIKGQKVDVFFSSLNRALQWGRRPVQVYLLKNS